MTTVKCLQLIILRLHQFTCSMFLQIISKWANHLCAVRLSCKQSQRAAGLAWNNSRLGASVEPLLCSYYSYFKIEFKVLDKTGKLEKSRSLSYFGFRFYRLDVHINLKKKFGFLKWVYLLQNVKNVILHEWCLIILVMNLTHIWLLNSNTRKIMNEVRK